MPTALADVFAIQAAYCDRMGSPFYAQLLSLASRACERDCELRSMLARFEAIPSTALRFAAVLHRWALDGSAPVLAAHFPSTGGDGDASAAWLEVPALVRRCRDAFLAAMRDVPQTNEPARAMPLMAGLLHAACKMRMPLRLFEIGASAGLNLRWDAYAYRGPGWEWGSPAASLLLTNSTNSGAPANLRTEPAVIERRGCDLAPLRSENAADRERLLSYVWPDQPERIARLRRALSVAQQFPVAVDRADAVEWLGDKALPQRGTLTVVMHSVVMEHMTPAVREALAERIEECASASSSVAPFAWLRMEFGEGAYETRLRLWPHDEERLLARSDGHAQRLEWRAA